jgi:hypothetical protein
VSVAFARVLGDALHGEGAHVEVSAALDGTDWRLAGAAAPSPAHAGEGWPGRDAPTTELEWQGAVDRFNAGLAAVEACVSV